MALMKIAQALQNRGNNGFGSAPSATTTGGNVTFGTPSTPSQPNFGTTGQPAGSSGTANTPTAADLGLADPELITFGSTNGGGIQPIGGDIMELAQMFIVYAFIIAAALSAIFIFWGGIMFILSGGADDKISKAVNTIRYAIIGLIVTILSFTFVTIIGRIFGLNFIDYISYDRIRDSINRLVSRNQTTQPPANQVFPSTSGSTFNP